MVRWRQRHPDSNDPPRAAAAVRTLAVLLQAGARPHTAWRHLADTGDIVAGRVVARADAGAELVGAIDAEGGAWSDVAAAWEIATTVGAPLADVLRALSESLQDAAAAADDVRVALAEPTGTARLLLWLPFAGCCWDSRWASTPSAYWSAIRSVSPASCSVWPSCSSRAGGPHAWCGPRSRRPAPPACTPSWSQWRSPAASASRGRCGSSSTAPPHCRAIAAPQTPYWSCRAQPGCRPASCCARRPHSSGTSRGCEGACGPRGSRRSCCCRSAPARCPHSCCSGSHRSCSACSPPRHCPSETSGARAAPHEREGTP
ncbi:type II secretion system F family protein [Microbacterium sp. OR16]|uniref:type II secretion system F family protein n=1 Tax=Microbacterium sp. OR16 TaxID=3095345 RepID=UPI0039B6E36F